MNPETNIKPKTMVQLKKALDENGYSYRDSLDVEVGAMLKTLGTEEEALQTIKNLNERKKENAKMKDGQKQFCCRCKSDFPIDDNPKSKKGIWKMGVLRKLKFAPKFIREKYKDWLDSEIHGEGWICGNCVIDLTEGNI